MVNQVRVICILMWVQGGLELMAGLFFVGMGIFMSFFMRTVMAQDPQFQNANGPPPEVMGWFMLGMYVAMGLPALIAGGLHIFAGLINFKFRGRTLGVVSLALGLCSASTIYCAPTAIALTVYGLIVYLNPEVKSAFDMGEQGYSGDDVLAAFVNRPAQPNPPSA